MHLKLIMILREEILCAFILGFLFVYNIIYFNTNEGRYFKKMCFTALIYVCLECATTVTVNKLVRVHTYINYFLYYSLYFSAVIFCNVFFCYIVQLAYDEKKSNRLRKLSVVVPTIYAILLPFQKVQFESTPYTRYCTGFALYLCYTIIALYSMIITVIIIKNYELLDKNIKYSLVPLILVFLVGFTTQVFVPEILFSGGCITMEVIVVFFVLENPARRFRERAYIDIDTGVKNKNCYEEDVYMIDTKFLKEKKYNVRVSCVLFDLNCLKYVNDLYGHLAGDSIIQKTASILIKNLRYAYNVYRIGGDEFLAIYIDTSRAIVNKELELVRKSCEKESENEEYILSIAMGYAENSMTTKCFNDILQKADKEMYNNKELMKELHPELNIR